MVLNRGYQFIGWVSSQKAVSMVFAGRASVVEEHPDKVLRSPSVQIKVPLVITVANRHFGLTKPVKFSRKNVMIRDKFTCQYCGKSGDINTLTIDHVIPKCSGGISVWDNVTTSCKPCNVKKGHQSLKNSGLHLNRAPYAPKLRQYIIAEIGPRCDEYSKKIWSIYLGVEPNEYN